ncbi:MarR family winged helix-turn-helix transcriptional regulator [Salinibacterium hongtaonis]|nr:MarR family transcriptional regulator [Salinibacterium hongtaonis]
MYKSEGPRFGPVHESTMLLRQLIQLSDDFERHMGKELTVNPTDLQAMQHLIMRGPMSPTDIAKALGMSTAAATVVVDRLTKVGHVTREKHPTDRRGIVVVPAPESVARAIRGLLPMITGIDEVIHEFEPQEQAVITEYLRRVVKVYRESIPSAEDEAAHAEVRT